MSGSSPDQGNRHSIRLKGYDYSQAGGYFVTLVSFRRECLFGEVVEGRMRVNSLGRIVQACWDEIPAHFPNTQVDAFVIMPNHVHGIVLIYDDIRRGTMVGRGTRVGRGTMVGRGTIYRAPTIQIEQFGKPTVGSLPTIIRTFKGAITRGAGRELNSGNIWQKNYYEHIIRNQADYERIAGYILDNPVHWDQDKENPQKNG